MAVAEGQDMQAFVRGLFQGSPDLSILTHAIVRKKYLAHVGQETLTKEAKEQLKQLVEKELAQMQVDDTPQSKELLTELQTSVRSGRQKRHLYASDSSGDEVKSRQELKKQRTGKELEVSSDEQDSGIDSKKIRVCSSPRPAGRFSGAPDQGDSGAEGHSDASGSNSQGAKKTSREAGGRKASQEHQRQRGRSGSESEETEEGQGSDLEEEIRGCKKSTESRRAGADVEQELKDCKRQKKRAFSKQKWKGRLGRGKSSETNEGSESEEENERLQVGKTHAKKIVDWSDREEEKEERGSQKAEIRTGQRTRQVQEESESWDESGDDSEEEDSMRKKVTNNKHRRKSVKLEDLESDSDETEDSQMRKEMPKTKTRRAGVEKWGHRLESNSEEGEEPARQIGKGRMTKAQRKSVSRKELEEEQGGCEKHRNPEKQQGIHEPKRSVSSSDESERETDKSKGLRHKKEGIRKFGSKGDESQSEAEEGGKGESKFRQAPASSSESESGSGPSEIGDQRKKRMIKKRSESKAKDKGTEKSQKENVIEVESEEDSEDSGSELVGEKKCEGQQKKGSPKPKRRSNSKEASENESVEVQGSSGSEDSPHYSKQRHRGKDREHSGKSEDHPSIQRLKRYIRECGVHRNYKKLLAGCRSRRAQVETLKKELENIGLKGAPSLAKCRALKKKREEAAEVASLDLSNIITTEGRPRRRNVWSLYSKPQESPSSPEESPIRRPATDWSRLRGVISSDGESN